MKMRIPCKYRYIDYETGAELSPPSQGEQFVALFGADVIVLEETGDGSRYVKTTTHDKVKAGEL